MKLDLKELNTLWINLDDQTERAKNITEEFEKIGLKNHTRISGIENKNRVLGCGLSMFQSVSTALKSLPTLILEDDVKTTEHYKNIIEIPDETDAIYLGISHWGMSQGLPHSTINGTHREYYNKTFLRIKNMCSLHAVIYLSEQYTNAIIEAIDECNVKNKSNTYYGNIGHVDIGTALTQKDFLVLTPNKPFYYQDCPNNEIFTRTPLDVMFREIQK